MDYIREELKRQRTLWSTLLLGAPRPKKTEEEDGTEKAADGAGDKKFPRKSLREQAQSAAGEALPLTLARRSGRERQTAARALGLPADEAADWQAVDGDVSEEAAERELWRMRVGGAVVNPKTISLAFQRDARRYDGGFSLY